MKRRGIVKALAILVAVFLLASCAQPAASQPASTAGEAQASAASTAAGSGSAATPDVEPVKVAVIQSLTGANASSAAYQVDTMQLCADFFNETNSIESLGGAPIELVWIDNMSDINAMKTVVENTFQDDTYDFCILQGSTAYVMPSIASVIKAGVPTFTKAQGDAVFQQGATNLFCIPAITSVQAQMPMEFFQWLAQTQDIDTTKFGILGVDFEHGISTSKTYGELLDSMDGFGYVFSELYPGDITDMSSIVTSMKQAGVEVLLHSGGDSDAKLLLNTMRTMNFNPIIMGSGSGMMYPSFYRDAGEAVIGVMTVAISNAFTTNAESNPEFIELRKKCFDELGHVGGDFLATFYSMLEIIKQTVEETGSRDWATNAAAMHTMEFTTTYQTVDADGNYTDIQVFAEDGTSPNSTPLIVQFREIEFEGQTVIEPVTIYPEANATYELEWGTS